MATNAASFCSLWRSNLAGNAHLSLLRFNVNEMDWTRKVFAQGSDIIISLLGKFLVFFVSLNAKLMVLFHLLAFCALLFSLARSLSVYDVDH
jgi:hypothetical protein